MGSTSNPFDKLDLLLAEDKPSDVVGLFVLSDSARSPVHCCLGSTLPPSWAFPMEALRAEERAT